MIDTIVAAIRRETDALRVVNATLACATVSIT
jgi:hypothetical protein